MENFGSFCAMTLAVIYMLLTLICTISFLGDYTFSDKYWECTKQRIISEGPPVQAECSQYTRKAAK